MNNGISKLMDPKFYIEKFCKIKGKVPGLVPFILNEAQKDFLNAFRKFNRLIILKARQIGFCLDPETKIFTSDFKWIKLDDIKIGQEIVSVDEFCKSGSGSSRKMRRAFVEAKKDVYEEAFRIKMSNGEELIATAKHKFLGKVRGAVHTVWRCVEDTRVGDEIRTIVKPWGESNYEDGWFGGIIDGEGSLSKKNRTGTSLTISQVEGPVLQRMLSYINNNYVFRIEWDKRKSGLSSKLGNKPVCKIVISNLSDVFRVMGSCRPIRFINRDWWENKKLPGNGESWAKVISIESLGVRRMIDLQTSEKTFIAEGFVSHNSTVVTGILYHRTIMTPGTNTALIGYNSDLTSELLDKVKTFYASTPTNLRPTIQYNSKYEVSFPKIGSKIIVLPSTENVGRGYTLHNVLATELSAWEKADEKMMTLEASVPITGKIVIESTPRGQGNLYHRMWSSDNDYCKKEYGWWWLYSEAEIEIIRRRMNDPQKFAQEYELTFLTSGRPVFDPESVNAMRKHELHVGDTVIDDKGFEHTVREHHGWVFYKEPNPESFYVCGADVAEGVTGGDYSVAIIFDRRSGEEVAFYRGLLAPDKFGESLNEICRVYNNALLAVEVNNHGLTTITILKQLLYPSMYFRPSKFEVVGAPWSEKLGWRTTRLTRNLLIDDLGQAIRDHDLIVHSKYLLDEMTVFVYDKNNNAGPMDSFHDDCIFATGIANQAFKVMSMDPQTQLSESHSPTFGGY